MENRSFMLEDLGDWQQTRETLTVYSRVLSAVPRMWLEPHPKWWHISLRVTPEGLVTKDVATPEGHITRMRIDLQRHQILLETDAGELKAWGLRDGLTVSQLAEEVVSAYAGLGVTGEYPDAMFKDQSQRSYDPEAAGRYFRSVRAVDHFLNLHRDTLTGEKGPVQMWPHGFDMTFEWFGDRMIRHEEKGAVKEYPVQINFGWAPGDPGHPKPYFFSNPWPFDASLVESELTEGASWFQDGWEGTIFPYESLVGDPEAERRLLRYWRRVFEVAKPTLAD